MKDKHSLAGYPAAACVNPMSSPMPRTRTTAYSFVVAAMNALGVGSLSEESMQAGHGVSRRRNGVIPTDHGSVLAIFGGSAEVLWV